jgi:thiamine biosynthesis lipoprotein
MQASIRRTTTTLAVAAVILVAACSDPRAALRTVAGVAQGTTYSLQWVGGPTESVIAEAAELELARIDALLSNYRPDSSLERFNALRSTEPIELPAELVALLDIARTVHEASDGCFDPTVRPLVRVWGFDGDTPAVPDADVLARARSAVGFEHVERVDATHVRKGNPTVEIDMASIGQGYTVARLAELLETHGSEAYLAEIGGEIVARGTKPGAVPWRVGIENPAGDAAGPALSLPPDRRTAVITSGSYRHFLAADGRRLSHVIDARSGWPVDHSLLAVTVVGPDAPRAAAWATALLCLGPVEASTSADREGVAALLWIAGDGAVTSVATSAFAEEWSARLETPAAP